MSDAIIVMIVDDDPDVLYTTARISHFCRIQKTKVGYYEKTAHWHPDL